MQTVSSGDSLHEMSNPILTYFLWKIKQIISKFVLFVFIDVLWPNQRDLVERGQFT